MMNRSPRPSSEDVAQLARVSRATVSAYLNRTRYVSPELGERIQQAIDQLNYTPDPLARALKKKDVQTIGLILPVMSRFYTPMMEAINEYARTLHYDLLIASSDEEAEREMELINIFIAKRISGILIAPCSNSNSALLNDIARHGIPLVQVNRRAEGVEASSVVSDNFKAAYSATEHLVKRGKRRIVLLGYDPTTLTNQDKKRGYDAARAELGVEADLTVIIKEHDVAAITEAFRGFLATGTKFDSVIATTQGKTTIAIKLLKQNNLRIPQDVGVIGFDDTPWSELLSPALTVVSENTYAMGKEAVQLLMERMMKDERVEPRHIVLEDEFILREST